MNFKFHMNIEDYIYLNTLFTGRQLIARIEQQGTATKQHELLVSCPVTAS